MGEESGRDRGLLQLPKHVLELILPRLGLKYLIRFGAVCRPWRSIAAESYHYLHRRPWLMISRDETTQTGTFLCLADAKFYVLKLTQSASESYCCGSSNGYLIMANREGNFLFDPFSKTHITLPQQYIPRRHIGHGHYRVYDKEYYRYYFTKAILLSCKKIVAALGCNHHVVEMCRPHDAEWSVYGVNKEEDNDPEPDIDLFSDEIYVKPGGFEYHDDEELLSDILFYRGVLYGITRLNTLVCMDLEECSKSVGHRVLNMVPMKRPTCRRYEILTVYLVESCGELLMVYKFRERVSRNNCKYFATKKFWIYKLDQSSDVLRWVQVESLGDRMLFLGKNSSISVSAKGMLGVRGNCIYFTEDDWNFYNVGEPQKKLFLDNGVCYLDDGLIQSFIPPADSQCFKHCPIWIEHCYSESGQTTA